MPKLIRPQRRQIIQGRAPVQAGLGQAAGAEAQATRRLAGAIEGIGESALRIQNTLDTIETEKLTSDLQTAVSARMEEIQMNGAPEGQDLGEYSQSVYEETVNSVLEKTSNGAVRRNLSRHASSFKNVYDTNILKIQKDNVIRAIEKDLKDINIASGNKVLSAKAAQRSTLMLAELEKNKAFVEDIRSQIGNELADKHQTMVMANLRQSYINSGLVDEDSAEEVLSAVKGESSSEELNEIFTSMEPNQRASAIQSLESAVRRRDSEYASKSQEFLANLSAKNALGESITTQDVGSAVSFAVKIKDQETRSKLLNAINKESSFNVSVVRGAAGKSLDELKSSSNSYISSQSETAVDKLKAIERSQRFLEQEVRLREEDPKAAVDRIDSVRALALQAAQGDETAVAMYYDKVISTQDALGMRRSVITKEESQGIATKLEAVGSTRAKAELIDRELLRFGNNTTTALNDLKRDKVISGNLLAYAYMTSDAAKNRIIANESLVKQKALTNEGLKQAGAKFTENDIDTQIGRKMSEYTRIVENNPGLKPLIDQMKFQVKTDAMARGVLGQASSASSAVEDSVDLFMKDNFINVESGSSKVFSPRFRGANEKRLRAFLDVAQDTETLKKLPIAYNKNEFSSVEDYVTKNEGNFYLQTDPKHTDYVQMYRLTSLGPVLVEVESANGEFAPFRYSIKDISNGVDPLAEAVDARLSPFSQNLINLGSQRKTIEEAGSQPTLGGRRF